MRQLYGGIDLHANNSVIALLDDTDKVTWEKRLPNEIDLIVEQLSPYLAMASSLPEPLCDVS